MRVLLLGGSGFVGGHLLTGLLSNGHTVNAPSHSDLDVRDSKEVREYLDRGYECVINCVARIDMEGYTIDEIRSINSDPSRIISEYSVYYIYMSTASVFRSGTYTISDTPNPNTMYGISKYDGEREVLSNSKDYMILRSPAIFGPHRKCMPYKVLHAVSTGEVIHGSNKVATHMLVDILVGNMLDLITSHSNGIYHICSSDYCTYYEFIKYILERFGYDNIVEEVPSDEGGIVLVPNIEMPTWREMVDIYYRNCNGDWRI